MGLGLTGLQGIGNPYGHSSNVGGLSYANQPMPRAPMQSVAPNSPGGLSQLSQALSAGKLGAGLLGDKELSGDFGMAGNALGAGRSAYNIMNGGGSFQDYLNLAKSGYQLGSQTGLIGGGAGSAAGGAGSSAAATTAPVSTEAASAGAGISPLGVAGGMYTAMQIGMGIEDKMTADKERRMAEHGAQIANELYGSGFDPRRINSSQLWSPDQSGYGALNQNYLNSIGLGNRGYDKDSLNDYLLWAAPNYRQNVSTLFNMNMQPYLAQHAKNEQSGG